MSDVRKQIRDYLSEALSDGGDKVPFTDQEPLFSSGRLESLRAVELILFLEKEFNISASDPHFDASLLDSVDEIMTLVER